jgi:cytosine/creatinine deaminase
VRHLDIIFGLADRYGVEVDIHLHEPGDLGAFAVELIAERTRVLGLKGKVAISHVFCLGDVNDVYFGKLLDLLLENDISIMTLTSGTRPFPPILKLHAAGVRLFTGNDGIRDTWSPYGTGDMLERAWILSYRSGFRKDEQVEVALHMTTYGGASVVGTPGYGVEVGCQADLVLVPGETLTEAVMARAPRTLVLKRGRIVARDGECLV